MKVLTRKFLPIMGALVLVVALVVSFVPSVVVYAQTAGRNLPDVVTVNTEFDVGITASDYGAFGQIIETLPAGFTYTGVTDLEDFQVDAVSVPGQVTFTLLGETAFTYTVMAPATASIHTFAGILKNSDNVEYVIGGDTQVEVIVGVGPTASRDLPDEPVLVDTEFDVGITASDYGAFGQIIETLPAGFTYSGVTDLADFQVDAVSVPGQVTFTLLGETAFTYTVMAPATASIHTFAGILKDADNIDHVIGGDFDVEVIVEVGPVEFDETFTNVLAEDASEYICLIPGGATELEITLTATADIDLELYDGTTHVIGWGGEIDSSGETTDTYEGDTFSYSGWDGGNEYITALGPLSQPYDVEVFGFEAGDYVVTVSYVMPGPDVTPPVIDIIITGASTVSLGNPVTITVSATDPSGVMMVMFMVSSSWPEGWGPGSLGSLATPQLEGYEDLIQYVMSFGDEASLTFMPGWAGTYTVDAWAVDNSEAHNMTPEGAPETATFEVVE